MRLEIKAMRLHNFKGCKDRKVEFDGNTKVLGANSTGKSSLFCAWMWLMAGTNEHLVSNPNIIPYGETECISSVEADITIDGKYCTISKSQKYKEKLDDSGKTVSSTINSFTVNGIDKSATAFAAEMKERGIDLDNFLMLSHVFAFTADTSKKGREEMRKVLFEMVEDASDLEISKEIGVPDVTAELEKGYKIDEIEQMAKQSLKKITDNYGKSGELIDAKIDGLLEGKAEINATELALKEAAAKAQIAQIEENIKTLGIPNSNTEVRIAELEAKIKALLLKAREDYYIKRDEHLKDHIALVEKFRGLESTINLAHKHQKEAEAMIEQDNKIVADLRVKYDTEFATQFEHDSKCPVCGQNLPDELLQNAEQEFNNHKAKALNDIMERGNAIGKEIERQSEIVKDAKETIEKFTPEYEKLKAEIDVSSKWDMSEPQVSDIPEATAIKAEISDLKAKMDNSYVDELNGLNEALGRSKAELTEIQGTYKVIENNKTIETKVMELRQQKKEVEIQRAMHEKMVYEVETFKKYKNNKLSDSINSHFKVAQFRLFKVLKNGSIEDDCAILVNGKELNSQLNQSTQILALTDVIAGLQAFKNQELPVFLDDHALFTSENDKAITLKCQTIKLIAAEGINELKVEKGA